MANARTRNARIQDGRKNRRPGLTLIEILAVVAIIGVVSIIVLSRLAGKDDATKVNACHVNRGNIEVRAQMWYRANGSWPSNPLADSIGSNATYFPDLVIPTCPVDGSTYVLDQTTGQVTGHDHE